MSGNISHPILGCKIGEDKDAKRADDFVRAKVPEVANAELLSYTTQVVAGTLYRFKYAGYKAGDIQVLSQQWNKEFLEITLPDGKVITNQ